MTRLCVVSLLFFIFAVSAHAAIPSANYVHEFFNTQCHNLNLEIPGAGNSNLSAKKYVLGIVDSLNELGSTHAADAATNNIVSLGYLHDTLPLLAESMTCCLGGVVESDGKCRGCGTWVRASDELCWDAGEYREGDTCKSCPSGYVCPGGTGGKVPCGAGFWCENNVRHPCDNGRNRCPQQNHTEHPKTMACDDGYTFVSTMADECIAAGVYKKSGTCVDCEDGYICPFGTNSRVNCGPGFYCVNSTRNPCPYGTNQCPGQNHISLSDTTIACDDGYTFVR